MKKLFLIILLTLTSTAAQIEVLQWDAYQVTGATFRLYTHTNSPAVAGTFRDVGTNLTAIVGVTGIQFHQVTAFVSGVESLPSNEITVTNLPLPRPTNLRRLSN